MKWYAVKKKSDNNWTHFKLDPDNLPELKRGYEILGPFDTIIKSWMAVNKLKQQDHGKN